MKRRGNCYVTVESLWHLLGGARSRWRPHHVRFRGDVHWFLVDDLGAVLDPTAQQFGARPPSARTYARGRACGFLTKRPSRRARAMMTAMLWQDR